MIKKAIQRWLEIDKLVERPVQSPAKEDADKMRTAVTEAFTPKRAELPWQGYL